MSLSSEHQTENFCLAHDANEHKVLKAQGSVFEL